MSPTQLYRHYNADDELLYVGISKDAVVRLKQHPATMREAVARSEITMFANRQAALEAEAKAIKKEKPKLNVTHLPRGDRRHQHSMTGQDYRKAISQLGLTQGEAAKFLGISIRSSNGYANGALVPEYVAKLLRLMIRLGLSPEDVK